MRKAPRPLVPLLRELDGHVAEESMSVSARSRIGRAITQRGERKAGGDVRWIPALSFAAGAALVIAVVGLRLGAADPSPAVLAASPHPELGAFAVQGDRCRSRPTAQGSKLAGECRLVADHMVVQSWDSVVVDTRERDPVVLSGRAVFDVEHVDSGSPPVRVHVSHGVIEVLGTRFAVEQGESGGYVDLFEGRIQFRDGTGAASEVVPGQRLYWPARDVQAPAAGGDDDEEEIEIEDEPQKVKVTAKPVDPTQIIEKVGALRSQGRYSEAVRVLQRALSRRYAKRTRETLSYELGDLLVRYLRDRTRACRHLNAHQRRYRGGRYHRAVQRKLDKLDCKR